MEEYKRNDFFHGMKKEFNELLLTDWDYWAIMELDISLSEFLNERKWRSIYDE